MNLLRWLRECWGSDIPEDQLEDIRKSEDVPHGTEDKKQTRVPLGADPRFPDEQ